MSSTVSVSKGCFAFPKKSRDTLGQYSREPWYNAYNKAWTSFKNTLEEIETKSLRKVLEGILKYVSDSPNHRRQEDELPAALLLTGVNMPDHSVLFSILTSELKKDITPHVAILWAQDCNNLKSTVERLCSQFMTIEETEEDIDEDDYDEEMGTVNCSGLSKAHCTMPVLVKWYKQLSKNVPIEYKTKKLQSTGAGKALVVVIPNFECFSPKVLQDFFLILSANRKSIPLMLILGVATSVSAVHKTLPHHVSSKLCIQLFQTERTVSYFNGLLNKVILVSERPFHLGSKTFGFLLDAFLYCDFSVAGFIQGFKYCMTQHFFGNNWTALCCHRDDISKAVKSLKQKDLEIIKSLPSVRRHIESFPTREEKAAWLKNDDSVRVEIQRLLFKLHDYCSTFYVALRSLYILVADLPGDPLGKNLSALYAVAASTNITSVAKYQECIKYLRFLARDTLISKLEKVSAMFSKEKDKSISEVNIVADDIEELILELKCVDTTGARDKSPSKSGLRTPTKNPLTSPKKTGLRSPLKNRAQFKQRMLELAKQNKAQKSPYEELLESVLDRLTKFWEGALIPPTSRVLHEVMFFDDLSAVQLNINGTPRVSVHTALNDPQCYLKCECCQLSNQSDILPSLPDLSIVYKLHLESGRHINMYDWLQSYVMIVRPNEEADEQREVDPELQARFTRAVAELQFLGYIKSSTRKTDHVTRLTWT